MPLKLRPPPVDHDISRQFEPVDRRNIGGNGCFNAGVFVVRHKRSGKKYVEKKISPQSIDDGTVPHPNIVKYIHGFIDEHGPVSKASMYLEYCDRGNLHDYVENLRGPLDEDKVWDLFMQFVNAVAFMQYGVLDACMDTGVPRDWIGVVHRDIKPDNAFLCSTPGSSRLRLVLGDFGQAIREDDDGNWGRQYLNGNLMTTPPEVERHGFSITSYSTVTRIMCGITAVVQLVGPSGEFHANGDLESKRKLADGVSYQHDPHSISVEEQLDRSLAAIDHRGPDSRGVWVSDDGNIGLGSCRLEINGLGPGGQQPFSSSDGTIHAVVNGELYDHQQIRADMAQRSGYRFKGGSDSEIVMALYEYYGLSFLSHLRGEFALCLYDANKQLLLAARDRSGIKPLFWTIHQGRLLLASEAKALLPFGWRPEWDVRSIINKAWLTEEKTIFKGLRKIRSGSYLTCLSLNHIAEEQYWDHDYPEKEILETRTEEEMIEGVRSRMLDAVRVRLQADVPVGIHLSGGIDSAVIAGMAKHLLDNGEVKLGSSGSHHLRCLGVAFDKESGFDESHIAQNTADFLGVDFQKAHMDEAALAANFEEAVWFDEQPHLDLGFIGKHALSKLTRDSGLKTVLTGENKRTSVIEPLLLTNFGLGQGSDEIFGGYDVFLQDYLREADHAWPNNDLSEYLRLRKLQERKAATAAAFATWTGHEGTAIPPQLVSFVPAFAYTVTFPQLSLSPWITSHYPSLGPQTALMEGMPVRAYQLMAQKWHPLHSAQYVWNKTALPNLLLITLSDRTEMSHSVEGRVPFLDHGLMEYVNALPPSVKIRYEPHTDQLTEKWILRQASRPFITEELYTRKKHPYSAPSLYPVGGPLYQLMKRLITRETVEALGFVDWVRTEGLVEKAFREQDQVALRSAFGIAQWVVLSQRFGVSKAEP
ncbi:MAG: hypothetical protein Q9206_003291 [Seirophora lacunosa]